MVRGKFQFFTKVCMSVKQSIKDILTSLWVLFFNTLSLWYAHFKVLYSSVPEILRSQNGSKSKLLNSTHFHW